MKVRRLEINGFKSFADKSTIDFPHGMCAVVGPNGCGKSNVVDAVRWVLGEQSIRQLRGRAKEDVLFNGSEGRGKGGMAEVSMVFENQGDVSHPQFADLAEIMVSRRLYRSGESEYLINKVPCRLKDIQQLLMDTGLGNRAYAIIEQGRVAAFIEARPEDRRLWLEEAAGITRYKNQKKVSLRKMEGAQDNLSRLQDIIHEVETQMKRLERQAAKAQRYAKLRDQIRELDLNIASHEYERLINELSQTASEADAVGAQLLLANQRVTGLETDQETLKVQLVGSEQEISRAAQKKMETQGLIQKTEAEITLLGRDAENQRRMHSRYAEEKQSLAASLKEHSRELESTRRQRDQAQARLDQSQEQVGAVQEEVAARLSEQRSQEALVDDCKQALVDHLSRSTQINNRLADLERLESDLNRRRESLAQRSQSLRSELDGLEAAHRDAKYSLDNMSDSLAGTEDQLSDVNQQRQSLRSQLKEASSREQEATRKRHALSAAVDAMKLSLSSYDWTAQGVRQALKESQGGGLGFDVLGLVADHLTVKPGSESLVETALGPLLQALVVADGAAARALASWAHENELGRIMVLALDELSALCQGPPAGASPLAELARPKPGFEPLSALLAGVGWCRELDQAWQAAGAMSAGQAVVDQGGNRLDLPGSVLLGQVREDSILIRQNELQERQAELEAAQEEQNAATGQRRSLEGRQASLEEEASRLNAVRQEQERSLNQQEKETYRLAEAQGAKTRELQSLEFDASEIAREGERFLEERQRLEGEEQGLGIRQQELEEDLSQAQSSLAESREELEDARDREGEMRLTMASLHNQAENASRELSRLEQETKSIEQRIEQLSREITTAQDSVEDLTSRRDREQERLGNLLIEMDEQEESHRRAKELYNQAQMRSADLDASLKQARFEQRQAQEASQSLDLRKQQLDMTITNLCDQIMERCRVDLSSEHQTYLPQGSFDPETNREKLSKLRQRLAKLGSVNLEAISEHEALSERHGFLLSQKEDLESSLQDLRTAIRKINKSSRDRFRETFDLVNQRLGEIFPVLFNGGQAQMILEEGVDPLESGLMLMVELPGKKVKHLEALSGGEKALAAVAVMFALFLIRPAPFCILDEVDAPLDEANIGRFHDLLSQLGAHSQIMLITHSRRTMEIMETLYGVTMEEKGVSKLLSVSLKRGEALAA